MAELSAHSPSEIEQLHNPNAPAERFLNQLELYDPEHKLADPEYRSELLQKATPFEAAVAVAEVHRVLYGENAKIDDETVNLGSGEGLERKAGFVGVHPDDRAEVFNYAFEKSQEQAAIGNMELAGHILGSSIVALQTFADGNKRTSRAVYRLISEGYDGSQADKDSYKDILSYTEEARGSIFYSPQASWNIDAFISERHDPIYSNQIKQWALMWSEKQPVRAEMQELIPIEDENLKKGVIDVLQQNTFGPNHLIDYLGLDPELITNDKERAFAQILEALQTIDLKHGEEIIARDRGLKKEFLIRLIDATTGDKPFYQEGVDGKKEINAWVNITGLKLE